MGTIQAKPRQDMGTGSVRRLMVQMAVPAVVAQVINLLYNVVDRIYIGHIPDVGGTALTGVGLFTPILMLMTAFGMPEKANSADSPDFPPAQLLPGQGLCCVPGRAGQRHCRRRDHNAHFLPVLPQDAERNIKDNLRCCSPEVFHSS